MARIFVKEIATSALSEAAGTKLRNVILDIFNENADEEIVLDFSNITLFATMFFNSSIGFLIAKGYKVVDNITIENISRLGLDTLEHSKQNAIKLTQHPEISIIISDNIAEDADE